MDTHSLGTCAVLQFISGKKKYLLTNLCFWSCKYISVVRNNSATYLSDCPAINHNLRYQVGIKGNTDIYIKHVFGSFATVSQEIGAFTSLFLQLYDDDTNEDVFRWRYSMYGIQQGPRVPVAMSTVPPRADRLVRQSCGQGTKMHNLLEWF